MIPPTGGHGQMVSHHLASVAARDQLGFIQRDVVLQGDNRG